MTVFPLIRSVGLKAATASSRVETVPMVAAPRPLPHAQTLSASLRGERLRLLSGARVH